VFGYAAKVASPSPKKGLRQIARAAALRTHHPVARFPQMIQELTAGERNAARQKFPILWEISLRIGWKPASLRDGCMTGCGKRLRARDIGAATWRQAGA
jgi:hypothetical protein